VTTVPQRNTLEWHTAPDPGSALHTLTKPELTMKALTTRVGTYITGDLVAESVADYGLALAQAQRLDSIDVPFRTTKGEIARVQLTVGWMVDLDVVSLGDGVPEVTDTAFLDDVRERHARIHPNGDTPMTGDELGGTDPFGEY
jgi:hypothetical protein